MEKAKRQRPEEDVVESDPDEVNNDDGIEQPKWMDLLQPNPDYVEPASDFVFDDGGPDYDWSHTTNIYPSDYGIKLVETLDQEQNFPNNELVLPEVSLALMNKEQRFAYNIVKLTLIQHKETPCSAENPLLLINGTVGTGKSFLIKCLVYSIRKLFQSNKSVQVMGPTGTIANLLSGQTIQSFLKVLTGKQLTKGTFRLMPQVTKLVAYSKLCTCVKVPKLCLHVTLIFRLVCSVVLWAKWLTLFIWMGEAQKIRYQM